LFFLQAFSGYLYNAELFNTINKKKLQIRLSSASLHSWNDGMLEYWDIEFERLEKWGIDKELHDCMINVHPSMHPCSHAAMQPCSHAPSFPNTPTPQSPIPQRTAPIFILK
jgi:hypothetical protein